MRIFRCILLALLPLSGQALEVNGTQYLSLREVAGKLGMKSHWLEKGKSVQLSSEWTKMVFEVHKRDFSLNGNRIHLGYPLVESRDRLYLSQSDFTHQVSPILTPQLSGTPPVLRHIILDPGHGGKDPGAENNALGLREKSLTLDLATRLKRKLEDKGFRVSLTRDRDEFQPPEKRAAKGNQMGGDLFVSLHFNATASDKVSGVETYAFTPRFQPSSARTSLHSSDRENYPGNGNDPWNTLAAYYVQRSMAGQLGATDRGLKRARFTVLRDLRMPGILIEGGFVTHPAEGRNIGSAAYRDRLVEAILEGILSYQRTLSRLQG
ncbi:MAG: N-acetylmuramoyl-L-alanine amidase [Opitutales bacterium]